ncbi:hypothetical protein [Thalassorhabdomicrobium marinisediminis]|nr:hypothetical protein [Thalassorhabdomicrobium marinisediminis]
MIFLSSNNIFIVDNYSKRVGFLFVGAVVLLLIVYRIPIRTSDIARVAPFGFLCVLLFLLAIVNGNSASFILTEAMQAFFILLVFITRPRPDRSSEVVTSWLWPVAIISAITVAIGVKLQFSYAGFLLLFLLMSGAISRRTIEKSALYLLAGAAVFSSLYGKSVFLSVMFILLFTLRMSFLRKRSFWKFSALTAAIGLTVFLFAPDLIFETGLYRKLNLFFSQLNWQSRTFDMSSAQRIFEANQVLDQIREGGVISALFGFGFGASIDMTSSLDVAILSTHQSLSTVRYIHFLFFYLLLKGGILLTGLFYLAVIRYLIMTYRYLSSYFRNEVRGSVAMNTLIMYSLFIISDAQVSASHMLSNPLFFAAAFTVTDYIKYQRRNGNL